MTDSHEYRDHPPAGWPCPGVFTPKRHYVTEGALSLLLDGPQARRFDLAGRTVAFAECGAACWPPDAATDRLPWCESCRSAWALEWRAPAP